MPEKEIRTGQDSSHVDTIACSVIRHDDGEGEPNGETLAGEDLDLIDKIPTCRWSILLSIILSVASVYTVTVVAGPFPFM